MTLTKAVVEKWEQDDGATNLWESFMAGNVNPGSLCEQVFRVWVWFCDLKFKVGHAPLTLGPKHPGLQIRREAFLIKCPANFGAMRETLFTAN